MSKAIKYSLISSVTLIIIIIIVLVIAVNVINPNKFKPLISKKVYEVTGRELSLSGDLEWSIFPLGIKINDITLSNAKGFSYGRNKDFLKVQYASVHARLLPLIIGKVEVSDIEVSNLQLNLTKNEAGENNWTMTNGSMAAAATDEQLNNGDKQGSSGGLTNITIPSIEAKNVTITWDDQQNNQQSEIRNLNLKVSNVQPARPFPVSGSLSVSSNQPAISGKINFKGKMMLNAAAKKFALNNFKIDSQWSGKSLPNGKLAATGKINANITSNSITINPLQLNLGQDDLTGNLTVKNFHSPNIKFDITSNQLNLDNYMAILKQQSSSQSSGSKQSQPINTTSSAQQDTAEAQQQLMKTLRQSGINGSVAIKKLTVMKANIQDIKAKINGNNGLLAVSPITAKLYRGTLKGDINVDVRSQFPKIAVKQSLSNIQINPLIQDMYGISRLSGVANVNANVTTSGFESPQLTNNMNGDFKLNVNKGTLKGIDVDYYMGVLTSMLNKQAQPAAPKDNKTDFSRAGLSGNIKNGIISSQDMLITGPGIYVSGQGDANLNDKKLNISLRAAKGKDISPTLPIEVTGSFGKPKVRPEYTAVLKGAAGQLKNTGGGVVNKFKSLFNK